MQFKPFEPAVEVNGQTVWSIVDGFTLFKQLPSKILLEEGIGKRGDKDLVEIDKNGWYSQAAWLKAFERISTAVGHHVLFNIGLKIPENAIFPPWVKDVDSAVQAIDVAYHLNH